MIPGSVYLQFLTSGQYAQAAQSFHDKPDSGVRFEAVILNGSPELECPIPTRDCRPVSSTPRCEQRRPAYPCLCLIPRRMAEAPQRSDILSACLAQFWLKRTGHLSPIRRQDGAEEFRQHLRQANGLPYRGGRSGGPAEPSRGFSARLRYLG